MITRRTKYNIRTAGVLIFLGIICLYFLFYYFYLKPNKIFLITPEVKIQKTLSLENAVSSGLEGTKGTYAVAIKNLKTGESYFLNEHQTFDTGSLYKLWVMAEVFNQIQNEQLKLDEVLTEDIKNLNNDFNIDSSSAELTEGQISLTVGEAINQMITISHNYATFLLIEKIKLSSINNFLKKNDLEESKLGVKEESPKTSASDIALFFEKLYGAKLATELYTNQMMDILKKQQINDKLPKNLPQGVVIAHKTGEVNYFSHDGGIVFAPFGDYIIVILSESEIPTAAEERIAQISKNVYEYFNN